MREREDAMKRRYVVPEAEQARREFAGEPARPPARGPDALPPGAISRGHYGFGLWAVAFTFMALVAFTTVPSPLYGIYRARDGFSAFMLTVIFAAYAVAVIASLLLISHLSDWFGGRRVLITAGALIVASALMFLVWKSVGG